LKKIDQVINKNKYKKWEKRIKNTEQKLQKETNV
jgi:hypothetical protein